MTLPNEIREPKQLRARQTREAVLSATLDILEEQGIEKISTNLIAKTAGINIATLYKYFNDKYEILNELALSFSQKQSDLICNYLRDTPSDTPIKRFVMAWSTPSLKEQRRIAHWSNYKEL